jgi:hypothetical protein
LRYRAEFLSTIYTNFGLKGLCSASYGELVRVTQALVINLQLKIKLCVSCSDLHNSLRGDICVRHACVPQCDSIIALYSLQQVTGDSH